MAELLLDSDIRLWVFLPIVLISFLVGIIRHYVTILLASEKKTEIEQVKDSHALIRSRLLRENGKFIPKQSFAMRKVYFNNENNGILTKNKNEREAPVKNPMTDPSMMTDMLKGNVTNVLPMIIIGGWINWAFSGFLTYPSMMTDMLKGNVTNVLPMIIIGGWINWAFSGFLTTKVPFPLTLRFKPMLQRGVELSSLDASWVSSASWYFLNVFGLRSMYTLILGQDNAADQTKAMQEQFSGAGMTGPQDPQKAFKAEWEALEISSHQWALEGVEEDITDRTIPPETIFLKK